MNKENELKVGPNSLSDLKGVTVEPQKDPVPQKSEFKQENKLPDTDSIKLSVEEKLSIAKADNTDEKKSALSLLAEKMD